MASFLKNLQRGISREGESTTEQESTFSLALCSMLSRRVLQEEGEDVGAKHLLHSALRRAGFELQMLRPYVI